MSSIDLNVVLPDDLHHLLATRTTIVACLCAAWCDVCKSYRFDFDRLAAQFPDQLYLWVDIEDQSDLVEDLEVDNFPTLLIQHQDVVGFYGTMQPDIGQLKRLILAQTRQTSDQLQQLAASSPHQRQWQSHANLRQRIANHI